MNNSDMILEFIDGELDAGSEQALFDEMAQRPELRSELRQYVMIGDAVRNDREAFTPPAEVERDLLGGLGLLPISEAGGTAGGVVAGATGGGAVATGMFGFRSLFFSTLTAFILGGLLAGGGVWLALDDDQIGAAGPTVAGNVEAGSPANGEASGSWGTSSVPGVAMGRGTNATGSSDTDGTRMNGARRGTAAFSREGASASSGSDRSRGTSRGGAIDATRSAQGSVKASNSGASGNDGADAISSKAVKSNARPSQQPDVVSANRNSTASLPAPTLVQSEESTSPKAATPVVHSSTLPIIESLIDSTALKTETDFHKAPTQMVPRPEIEEEDRPMWDRTIAFELRKQVYSASMLETRSKEVSTNPFTEEIAAGLYHRDVGSWWSIGLEGGLERYEQVLPENTADVVTIHQRPLVGWLAAGLRRDMNDLLGVPIFAQVSLGASQYFGPMIRGRIGTDLLDILPLRSLESFSIPVSLETSGMIYRYDHQYLATGRWGVNVGVQYSLGF